MEEMAWDGPKWGWEDLFRLIQTLQTFWATWIWILRMFIFDTLFESKFLEVQVPDFQNLVRPGLRHLDQNMLIVYCKYWCLSSRPPFSSRRDESKCHQVLVLLDQNKRRVSRGPFKAPKQHR